MTPADLDRYLCAVLGVFLDATCVYCIFRPMTWDQRLRFIALALLGVVTVGGQLARLGEDGNWRMPVLTVGMAAALVGSLMYLRRTHTEAEK